MLRAEAEALPRAKELPRGFSRCQVMMMLLRHESAMRMRCRCRQHAVRGFRWRDFFRGSAPLLLMRDMPAACAADVAAMGEVQAPRENIAVYALRAFDPDGASACSVRMPTSTIRPPQRPDSVHDATDCRNRRPAHHDASTHALLTPPLSMLIEVRRRAH